jgi:hypothetical protein
LGALEEFPGTNAVAYFVGSTGKSQVLLQKNKQKVVCRFHHSLKKPLKVSKMIKLFQFFFFAFFRQKIFIFLFKKIDPERNVL